LGVRFSFWEKISSFWENSLYFWEKGFVFGKINSFLGENIPYWEKFSLFGKGEALCGKRITKDVVKRYQSAKVKMYADCTARYRKSIWICWKKIRR